MRRSLTPQSSLEQLKQDAKRWLEALKKGDARAVARFAEHHPNPPVSPTLRDTQLALARMYGFPGWADLKAALEARSATPPEDPRQAALLALSTAADTGDLAAVERLLREWPGVVNEFVVLQGHTGRRTALHFAMNSMNEGVVAALLSAGADPNLRDEGDNAMPLHFAAEKGNLAVVQLLVEAGADPIGTGDMHLLEVIGWAAVFPSKPHLPVIEYLLSHGGRHNIASAVTLGDTAAIRSVVAADAEALERPMDETNHRRRPLHLAILKQQPAAFRALLELGADTSVRDAAGLSPLDQAALSGQREMADLLLAHGATVDLPAAVALGRTADVERLLRAEPDALRRGGRWQRLLLRAAERGSGALIDLLVRAGASVHTRDDSRTAVDGTHGYTALHAAAFHGNMDAVTTLLRLGADPAAREDKYWGTPAGWADHAGHTAVGDLIRQGPIDLFEIIASDQVARIGETLERDPAALERPFRQLVTGDRRSEGLDRAWTPLHFAVANDKEEAVAVLLSFGAGTTAKDAKGRTALALAAELTAKSAKDNSPLAVAKQEGLARMMGLLRTVRPVAQAAESFERLVARFLSLACLDWRHGGSERARARADAGRILSQHPEIGTASIYTAVTCGDLAEVRRRLESDPGAALLPGGPRRWAPILYLCSARLPQTASADNAAEILRLLLDAGADATTFYLGGNADIHYTALTCVLGRGEEQALTHPAAPAMAELLLAHGADPFDNQVLYNVFADHASRHYLSDDIVWLLDAMYRHSVRRGTGAVWQDPGWPQFDLWGAPSLGDSSHQHYGAHFMLATAIDRNLLGLAEWMLQHGAGPNTPPGPHKNASRYTLWQEAERRGLTAMRGLLERYGATPMPLELSGYERFQRAVLSGDRNRARQLVGRHTEYLGDHRALFEAAGQNNVAAVELLLELGVSVDVTDPANDGSRALHAAAYAGAVESARLLIRRGAAVDPRESNYQAIPLGMASFAGQQEMIELLGQYSRDIWELTYTGRVARVAEVLEETPALAKVSSPDAGTPLHWLPTETEPALEIARLLLQHGADPSVRDGKGRTAGEIARGRGLDHVVELLGRRD